MKTMFLIVFILTVILSYLLFSIIFDELINMHQVWVSEVNIWISKLILLL